MRLLFEALKGKAKHVVDWTEERVKAFADTKLALAGWLHRTTAYHPQANGLCERFHRSMKAALRASLHDDSWVDRLPWVMMGLRMAPKEDLQTSPAELLYGQPLRVPGDFLPTAHVPIVCQPAIVSTPGRWQSFCPGAYNAAWGAAVPHPARAAGGCVFLCAPRRSDILCDLRRTFPRA